MWELIGYALVAVGSLLSTFLTNQTNKEESAKQRDWQESMQDKENEYNLPVNQLDRANDAGINPMSVAMSQGGTAVTGTTSVGHGNYQLPNIYDPMSLLGSNASGLASAFNSTQQALSDKTFRGARLDQIQLQNNQIKAQIANLGASTEAQLIANKYADARELWALAGKKAEVSLTYAEVAKTNAVTRQTYQNIKNLILEASKTESEIDLNYLKMDEVLAHIDVLKSEQNLNVAKTGETVANTGKIESETSLIEAETSLKSQESDRYSELTDKVIEEFDALIKKYMAETGKTEEEAFWILFDKADQYAPKVMGVTVDWPRAGKRVKLTDEIMRKRGLNRR